MVDGPKKITKKHRELAQGPHTVTTSQTDPVYHPGFPEPSITYKAECSDCGTIAHTRQKASRSNWVNRHRKNVAEARRLVAGEGAGEGVFNDRRTNG
jgi:hypothetical protein